ncbi:MAG: cellobiose phosphorylase [Candidatus Omnitrophota bacterium]
MKKDRSVEYYLQNDGKFVINNYDLAKPFASFFPGIAGLFGIPMWVFYVNRGQGIASFGVESKRNAILEFFPANKAWQFASRRGFRTFIKNKNDKENLCYEPFRNQIQNQNTQLERKMFISPEDFSVQEDNRTIGLKIDAKYFTMSNEPMGCLVRNLTIKNTAKFTKSLELIDGLAQVIPCGANDRFLKDIGRTIEAWMQVEYVTKFKVPFYKLAVDPSDSPQVLYIKGGNFYYSYANVDNLKKKTEYIVDPDVVFGQNKTFQYPRFFCKKQFQVPAEQITSSKTPSAFSYISLVLKPQQEVTITSLIGYAREENQLQTLIAKTNEQGFLVNKAFEYKQEVAKIQSNIFTKSSNDTYDLYCKQTYLDNVLRGGLAITLKGKEKSHIYHVYSRKHGDLERDYNNFLIEPTYLSQGNGNYRDVNQNRRDDVWFNTNVQDVNIIAFFNLIQLDGFNPLVVYGDRFKLRDDDAFKNIGLQLKKRSDLSRVHKFIKKQFALGDLFVFLEINGIDLKVSKEQFLTEVLSSCKRQQNAEHGEGFWVDHWTYNLDALESYLSIYPEKLKDILLNKKQFVYFNNCVKVKPRDEKYILYNDTVRQYHAVGLDGVKEESEFCRQKNSDDWAIRTNHGNGSIYKTTLLSKMICLLTNKMASLDAFGCGIEMEANKPGWYDALNGLPGLFGSSVCETFELKRLIDFILNSIKQLNPDIDMPVSLPKELHEFIKGLEALVDNYLKTKNKSREMTYWDKSYALKEAYRKQVAKGINGKLLNLKISEIKALLTKMSKKLEISLANSKDKKTGLYHTYFINEVTSFNKIKTKDGFKKSKDGLFCVRPKKFKQKPLPLFLEAQVHALRCSYDAKQVKALYANTKKSDLYDKPLKMYKVNTSLEKITKDIGRARVFTPGWLENESIWLHMEYKFLLELLRNQLYDDFFADFKNVLVPFQPAERYGRSILENSSFLVSSAFPDKTLHGNGFVARLSGSTAEFITMWLWMNVGQKPFRLDQDKNLTAKFEPALPAWMFTKKESVFEYCPASEKNIIIDLPQNSYAFKFLNTTLIIYHNPKNRNTYGSNGVKPVSMQIMLTNNKRILIASGVLNQEYAQMLRSGQISRIDIELG